MKLHGQNMSIYEVSLLSIAKQLCRIVTFERSSTTACSLQVLTSLSICCALGFLVTKAVYFVNFQGDCGIKNTVFHYVLVQDYRYILSCQVIA